MIPQKHSHKIKYLRKLIIKIAWQCNIHLNNFANNAPSICITKRKFPLGGFTKTFTLS